MNPLLYVAAAVSLAAIVVTVYAFLSAPEGHEDKEGFHALQPKGPPQTGENVTDTGEDADVRTFFSAR